jgi:hypothetical protein
MGRVEWEEPARASEIRRKGWVVQQRAVGLMTFRTWEDAIRAPLEGVNGGAPKDKTRTEIYTQLVICL